MLTLQTETVVPADIVQQTWTELGYSITPTLNKVFVRTDPNVTKVGMLFLPPREAHFFGGMAHLRLVTATVLSTGSNVTAVKKGDRVVFQRLHFGHIAKLDSGVFVGWIECAQICGFPEDDTQEPLQLQ
jgi:hypothetical protein